jgi:hypothetical protein
VFVNNKFNIPKNIFWLLTQQILQQHLAGGAGGQG